MKKLSEKFNMKLLSTGITFDHCMSYRFVFYRDIVLYDQVDQYDSLPDKTFANRVIMQVNEAHQLVLTVETV